MDECPSNVEFIFNAYGDDFDQLIQGDDGIIITLKDQNISAGRIVIMKSMAMGKVIIASNSSGLSDYVNANNAYMIDNREHSLTEAIKDIQNNKDRADKKYGLALSNCQENF